ncbi:MAG: serine/threonine-protein phosphatase [Gammaproteobacteria bacterium]|nr:serine/threonine-protein phosphatase [Gammaproteobacteria bacterium]
MSPITSPDKVVNELNQLFVEKKRCTRYFTMVYGVLDTLSGVGHICQAGHPHPLLVDASGNVRQLGKGGMPVGMLAKAQFESLPFRLETGETLFLYSDGVPDSTNADGEAFGLARLEALLRNIRERPLDEQINLVTKQMTKWHAGSPIDDISMLALSRLPPDPEEE